MVWHPSRAQIAAAGGPGRRSARNADRPMNQSREAHRYPDARPCLEKLKQLGFLVGAAARAHARIESLDELPDRLTLPQA